MSLKVSNNLSEEQEEQPYQNNYQLYLERQKMTTKQELTDAQRKDLKNKQWLSSFKNNKAKELPKTPLTPKPSRSEPLRHSDPVTAYRPPQTTDKNEGLNRLNSFLEGCKYVSKKPTYEHSTEKTSANSSAKKDIRP